MKKNSKGFTLIELIAVLVIMAIIALIVTPLVMNLIRKARAAADRRSVDAYGRSVEIAMAGYLLDYGEFPDSFSDIAASVEYSGAEITCADVQITSDYAVHVSECQVDGRDVKIDDEWYEYNNSAVAAAANNSNNNNQNSGNQDPGSGE